MECDECKDKKSATTKIFPCDGCASNICTKCSKVTASEIKVLELRNGRIMRFLCLKCTKFETFELLNQTIKDKTDIIDSKDEIIALLKSKIKDLESVIQVKPNIIPSYSSVAQVKVSSSSNELKLVNNIPSILIVPRAPQSSEKTKKDLQTNVKPTNLKIGIKNIKPTKNGSMIVKCHNKEDLHFFKQEAEKNLPDYEIQVTKMRQPRFKIIGYSGNLNTSDLETCIRNQNCYISDSDNFSITYIKENRNKDTFTIFGEASPNLFHKMISNRRLFIEWSSYSVYEDISIQRCFKCQDHYHKTTQCKNPTEICGYCAEYHSTLSCPKTKNKKCINCVRANTKYGQKHDVSHETNSPDCPTYKYHIQILRSKINYDG